MAYMDGLFGASQHRIGTNSVVQIFDGGNVFRRRAQRQCPACRFPTVLVIIVDLLGFNCSVRKLRLSAVLGDRVLGDFQFRQYTE
jgi:hypothetical protein